MIRLSICIDIDGTVTEPYYWLKRANEYFGTSLTETAAQHYEYHLDLGKTKQECDRFYALYGETIHREAKVRAGAPFVIRQLFLHHYVHFVTAREEKMRQASLDWLEEHQIPRDTITFLGHTNKVGKAKELACNLFIEDRYENAVQLAKAGFDVLLMDCRYNQGLLPTNVNRVMNWYHIGAIIRAFEESYPFREFKEAQ